MAPGDFIDFPTSAEDFDISEYLDRAVPDARMLDFPEGRRALTRKNSLLFSLVYLRGRLKVRGQATPTFSDYHLAFHRWASLNWPLPLDAPQGPIDVWMSSRQQGKSTTCHCCLIWSFCHEYTPFIVIVSASEDQARAHMSSVTEMLKTSPLLREDYPHAARVLKRLSPEEKALQEDRIDFYRAKAGIIISKPVTGSMAGTLVGGERPSLIWNDDVEQIGEGYSKNLATKRLDTILTNVLPLNGMARVVWTCTNQMHGSIADEFKRAVEPKAEAGVVHSKPEGDELPDWLITDLNPTIHWVRPLISRPDGSRRSFWPDGPAMFSLEHMLEIEGTRTYAERYDCQPWTSSGVMFDRDMFKYGSLPVASFTVLSIDHARTGKVSSDYTALAVVRYSKALDRFEVVHVDKTHATGAALRLKILATLEMYPEITSILSESPVAVEYVDQDQGVFHDIPVSVIPVHQKLDKGVRYELVALEHSHGNVLYAKRFPEVESIFLTWPNVANDDVTDAICTAILETRRRMKIPAKQSVLAGRASYANWWAR